jgi:hypothetical protein
MRSILIIAATIFATSAYAQQLPLPKSGGCPPGFRESGAYCVADEDTRTLAMPRSFRAQAASFLLLLRWARSLGATEGTGSQVSHLDSERFEAHDRFRVDFSVTARFGARRWHIMLPASAGPKRQ